LSSRLDPESMEAARESMAALAFVIGTQSP
jgi:hypothetical protein